MHISSIGEALPNALASLTRELMCFKLFFFWVERKANEKKLYVLQQVINYPAFNSGAPPAHSNSTRLVNENAHFYNSSLLLLLLLFFLCVSVNMT